MAAKNLVTEREGLKSKVAKGKLKGKALKKAIGRIYYLNGRLKKTAQPKAQKRRPGRPKKLHVVSKEQRFLPGFLAQMDVVRVEEILTERLSRAIDKKVNTLVDQAFAKIPKNKVG